MPSCFTEKRNCHLLLICFYLSQFEGPSKTVAKGQLKLERSKYDQMISFACKAKQLERSCVQLNEVKFTAFSEPVFCDLFSFTSWAIASNQSSTLSRWLQRQSLTLSRSSPGVASSPFVLQITSDPVRSAKLLFDLKVASGDFPSGSTYLQLLINPGF